jgi:hypothetical protein
MVFKTQLLTNASAISAETTARTDGDATNALISETSARTTADGLQNTAIELNASITAETTKEQMECY